MSIKKKKLLTNTGILILVCIFCVGPLLASSLESASNTIQAPNDSLRASGSYSGYDIDLNNGYYRYQSIGYLSSGDYFYYAFSTHTPTGVVLDVYLLDYDNFQLKYGGSGYTIDSTLETSSSSGSGIEYVYSSDTYYLIFENSDTDCELDYSITTYVIGSYIPNIFGGFIAMMVGIVVISVVIAIIIIAVIIVAIRKNTRQTSSTISPYRKSSPQPAPSTPVYQQPSAPTTSKSEEVRSIIGFCRYCGEKTEVDATFCPKCGSRL